MTSRTRLFECKKWLLFSFCLMALIITIFVTIATTTYIDDLDDDDNYDNFNSSFSWLKNLNKHHSHNNHTELNMNTGSKHHGSDDDDDYECTAKAIIISVGVLTSLIQLMGLVGSFKEHYCLVMGYSIICLIFAAVNIVAVLQIAASFSQWLSCAIYLLIGSLGISFARDIRRLRSSPLPSTVVWSNNQMNANIPNLALNAYGGHQYTPGQNQFQLNPGQHFIPNYYAQQDPSLKPPSYPGEDPPMYSNTEVKNPSQ